MIAKRSINPKQKKEMELLARKIKQGFMSSTTLSWVSRSAYDTAWVAMVPHPDHPGRPLFPQCLQWVIGSQRRRRCGFWGQTDVRGRPTLDCLIATLACMAALKTWAAGDPHCIEEGLEFLRSTTGELLTAYCGFESVGIPRWFAVVFPGMLELAGSLGLDVFPGGFSRVMEGVFEQRRRILADNKEHDGGFYYPPLEWFLEALPADHAGGVDCAEFLASHQNGDGSLFRSPSATAFAFMATGDARCRAYLEAMVAEASVVGTAVVSHGVGVPAVYPVDELLQNLVMVDVLEGLGLDEHFTKEIADAVHYIHR
ncbi:hypothetical protein Taro_052343 [Colocasia esculenta]|uniref:Uncharacterized protein n=1 Tax=Colocasia esculenta TaxID=4460 RepID=A0A843XJF6_COLES|nr:hypothetical protein [Colocasia esculenta]